MQEFKTACPLYAQTITRAALTNASCRHMDKTTITYLFQLDNMKRGISFSSKQKLVFEIISHESLWDKGSRDLYDVK